MLHFADPPFKQSIFNHPETFLITRRASKDFGSVWLTYMYTNIYIYIYICIYIYIYIYLKRVCEADARPLPKQRVKGHKPYVANKNYNTNNVSKASNAILNNTNAQASCNALETIQARPAIQSSCTSSNNRQWQTP